MREIQMTVEEMCEILENMDVEKYEACRKELYDNSISRSPRVNHFLNELFAVTDRRREYKILLEVVNE